MSNAKDLMRQAIEAGATFSDFVTQYAAKNTPRDQALIAKAREQHHCDGELEIDDTTICSGTDGSCGGDYVLAWVWVAE